MAEAVNLQTAKLFNDLCSKKTLPFEGADALTMAEAEAEKVDNRHEYLIKSVRNILSDEGQSLIAKLEQAKIGVGNKPPNIANPKAKPVMLVGNVTLVRDRDTDDLVKRIVQMSGTTGYPVETRIETAFSFIAAYVSNNGELFEQDFLRRFSDWEKFMLQEALSRIAAAQTLQTGESKTSAEINRNKKQVEFLILRVQELGEGVKYAKSMFENIDGLERKITTKVADAENAVGKAKETIDEYQSIIGANLEDAKLAAARNLWSNRAKQHLLSTYGFSVLSALLLLLPLVLTYFFRSNLMAGIASVELNSISTVAELATKYPSLELGSSILAAGIISRIILFVIPIGLYLWFAKISVRFLTRSLLLLDDAQQRETMMNTYIKLIEEKGTVPADRAIVLEALFRRAPGHGNDTVEPFNISEIAKMGLGKVGD